MKILNTTEQERFDNPPIFSSSERKKFYEFPVDILKRCAELRTTGHQIYFLLMCGYFKARKQFFKPGDFHCRDIQYIARLLDVPEEQAVDIEYLPRTRQRHELEILQYYGYERFDKNAEQYIEKEISEMVRTQLKPKLIFWRCVDLLTKNRFCLPRACLD